MRKVVINSLKYILFFAVGVLIFWLIYRKIPMDDLKSALKGINYFWLLVSILFGVLANLSRAMRWKMLIKPLGYNPRLSNTFLSVLVMYFVNLIIPRAGEIARCTVIARTDKVPFTKLVGTVFVERLADTIMLFFLAILIFTINISVISKFFIVHPDMITDVKSLISVQNILLVALLLIVLIVAFVLIKKRLKKSSGKNRLIELKNHFFEGIKSIKVMEKKWAFFAHTFFIFLMWLMMLYVVFLAYEPTKTLSIRVGMVAFLMGGLAMLAPIQGGIGAWHFMVYETLYLYGISIDHGKIFALIAHTTTNLIYIVFGGVALLLLMFLNSGFKKLEFKELTEESVL